MALEQVIDRALAKDAEQRYQRAEEMLDALEILKQQLEAGYVEKRRETLLRFHLSTFACSDWVLPVRTATR
jgi:hypothetical protein